MIVKYLLPILAIAGALLGIAVVFYTQKTLPVQPILFPPPTAPYSQSISGAGIIEASSQNISIGSPFNEIITKINVKEGDKVKKGDILFQLDTRILEAQLTTAQAVMNEAKTTLADKALQYSFYERLKERIAVSEQIYEQTLYALYEAEKSLKVAEAQWAEVKANIEKSIIRAPIDGEILQVNIHLGEIAPIVPFISAQSTWLTAANGTLILMGNVNPLQVRVDIDEDDAWRFERGTRAMAYVRGNRRIYFPIQYYRTEPYIIPKSSFTGATTERVDTRVLQVLYQFDKKDLPIYAGQMLDVFIEAKPVNLK